jgi:hypothetical protein
LRTNPVASDWKRRLRSSVRTSSSCCTATQSRGTYPFVHGIRSLHGLPTLRWDLGHSDVDAPPLPRVLNSSLQPRGERLGRRVQSRSRNVWEDVKMGQEAMGQERSWHNEFRRRTAVGEGA